VEWTDVSEVRNVSIRVMIHHPEDEVRTYETSIYSTWHYIPEGSHHFRFSGQHSASLMSPVSSGKNVNLEVPVYFLKAKHGYTVRKMEKDKWM
jgi:hypothetical protein